MAAYAVKEMFLTIQGEGLQQGRRAVFCRFAGCNLWSGREADRATADCRFCDTDFVGLDGTGGGRFAEPAALAAAVRALWDAGVEGSGGDPFVVLTGGEPLLQVDTPLIAALKAEGFTIAVETNGTIAAPEGLDWICVSPKAGTAIAQRRGDELKLVWPQPGIDVTELERWDFRHRLIQPMDGPDAAAALDAALALVMARPAWRLSIQTHKLIGVR
ncbi:MAG: 7-carboxy-7-deazaguanine synthase [Sphingomonas fennica]